MMYTQQCCLLFFPQVQQTYAAVAALNRELIELQQNSSDFASQLEAAGTRGELTEIKRRLEAHQLLLSQWEEKVRHQLEFISELQSPSRRHSMLSSFGRPDSHSHAGVSSSLTLTPTPHAAAQSAPASPTLWGGAPNSANVPPRRRGAFTPGPLLTGIGDANTPRQ